MISIINIQKPIKIGNKSEVNVVDRGNQKRLIQQDCFLKSAVSLNIKNKKINWNQIKKLMNDRFTGKEKTSKQCRQRYVNYSAFIQKGGLKSTWTQEDINKLYDQFNIWGTSWIRICQSLPGKSQNNVKNKFYGSLRKIIRKINQIGKKQFKKIKKNLRFQSVLRVIQASDCFQNIDADLIQKSRQLRKTIFQLIKHGQKAFREISITDLINELNKFNLATRSYKIKKLRKNMEMQQQNFPEKQIQDEKATQNYKQMNQKFTQSQNQPNLITVQRSGNLYKFVEGQNKNSNCLEQIKEQGFQRSPNLLSLDQQELRYNQEQISPYLFGYLQQNLSPYYPL